MFLFEFEVGDILSGHCYFSNCAEFKPVLSVSVSIVEPSYYSVMCVFVERQPISIMI